jgi:hypothetical protein
MIATQLFRVSLTGLLLVAGIGLAPGVAGATELPATATATAASIGAFDSEEHVKKCGTVTCTRYYTRAATKRINDNIQGRKNTIETVGEFGPVAACAVAGAVIGGVASGGTAAGVGLGVAGAACDKLAENKIGSLIEAAERAAEANQCFAVRSPKGIGRLDVVALYLSNYLVRSNDYCTDGV